MYVLLTLIKNLQRGETMISKKNTSSIQKALIALSTLLLVLGVFFITYHFMSNRTSDKFNDIINVQKLKIDEANTKAASSLKNLDKLKTSDKDKIDNMINTISSSEKAIGKALDELKSINPPERLKTQFDGYINAVSINRRILYQTCLILKNPRSNDLQKALDALDKYVTETEKAYKAIKLEKSSIKLPDDILLLPENMRQYSTVIYNDYTAKTNALEQYTQYFDSMDPIIYEYKSEMYDLNNYIILIKDGQTTVDTVYAEAEKRLVKLTEIKNEYIQISLPARIVDQHNIFNDLIDKFTYYCQDFKSTLMMLNEAGTNEDSLLEVNTKLDELEARYKEIKNDFKTFSQNYESNKAFYKDINNL